MTELTEQEISRALKRAVPDPAPSLQRSVSARTLARRMRRRGRLVASGAVVTAMVTVAVPVLVQMGGLGTSSTPISPANTPSSSQSENPDDECGRSCDPAAVLAAIERPLNLPTVAAGEKCPVSTTRTFSGGAGFAGRFKALGDGPLYVTPMSESSGTLTLRPDPSGWSSQKVIWVFGRHYAGPLLLRGARIDATGKFEFAHYLGARGYPGSGAGDGKPHTRLLYVRGGLDAPSQHALDSYPSGVYAKSSGCYAIQVDGQDFSETLVFRAVVRPSG